MSLLTRIHTAFDGVPQPRERTLFVAEAMDDYAVATRPDFIGRWQDLPDAHIEACPHALSYVDAKGMRYYLPAYMCWCLRQRIPVRSLSFDHTLYSLDPHTGDPDLGAYFRERFSLFTPAQMAVVAEFVFACANGSIPDPDTDAAARFRDAFWHRVVGA